MKFICNTSILADACQSVQRAVSTKTSIPAIEGIFIKALGSELVLTGIHLTSYGRGLPNATLLDAVRACGFQSP